MWTGNPGLNGKLHAHEIIKHMKS